MAPMRAPRTTLALLLLLLVAAATLLAACGGASKDEHAPVACGEGPTVILDALRAAPGEVVLAGEAPISDCLVIGTEEGELADFGEAALAAATKLNAVARAEPGGRANLELGYLLGAVARGSADTAGVHTDLLRRLTVAAKFAPAGEPLPPAFRAAYAKGFAAGRDHG
jgi:hypothetical protein